MGIRKRAPGRNTIASQAGSRSSTHQRKEEEVRGMKNKAAGCLFTLLMAFSIGASHAQQKELRKLRLNVFRTDAATVAARARGLFAAEGLEVAITTTPNSTDQMRGISTEPMTLRPPPSTTCWLGPAGRELRLLRLRKSPTEPSCRF